MSDDDDEDCCSGCCLSSDEEEEETTKEFTSEFEKKKAKFIPPKIQFKGDLSKRKIIKELNFDKKYISNLILFKNYILLAVDKSLHFYDQTLKLIFEYKIQYYLKNDLSLTNYNDETIIMRIEGIVIVINFYEKNKQIFYEVIQEIKDNSHYNLNTKLSYGFLLLGGIDKKYGFFQPVHKKEKISKYNKFELIFKIHKVHNNDHDNISVVVDLNNGRIFSCLSEDSNIKVIEYYRKIKPNRPRIIKSMNGYEVDNAVLLCDKYLLLMESEYLEKYYFWLMDTETLEIVYKFNTPQYNSFMCVLSENKVLYGSETRLAIDEFSFADEKFIQKTIFESEYKKGKTDDDGEKSYIIRDFLNENTFIAYNKDIGLLMIFQCEN